MNQVGSSYTTRNGVEYRRLIDGTDDDKLTPQTKEFAMQAIADACTAALQNQNGVNQSALASIIQADKNHNGTIEQSEVTAYLAEFEQKVADVYNAVYDFELFEHMDNSRNSSVTNADNISGGHTLSNGRALSGAALQVDNMASDPTLTANLSYTSYTSGSVSDGINSALAFSQEVINGFEETEDGMMDMNEFMSYADADITQQSEARNIFNMIDLDRDGKISKGEYTAYLMTVDSLDNDEGELDGNINSLTYNTTAYSAQDAVSNAKMRRAMVANYNYLVGEGYVSGNYITKVQETDAEHEARARIRMTKDKDGEIDLLSEGLKQIDNGALGEDADTIIPAMSEALINHFLDGNKITKEEIDNGSLANAFADEYKRQNGIELTTEQKTAVNNILNNFYDRFASSDIDKDSLSLLDLKNGNDILFETRLSNNLKDSFLDEEINTVNLDKNIVFQVAEEVYEKVLENYGEIKQSDIDNDSIIDSISTAYKQSMGQDLSESQKADIKTLLTNYYEKYSNKDNDNSSLSSNDLVHAIADQIKNTGSVTANGSVTGTPQSRFDDALL